VKKILFLLSILSMACFAGDYWNADPGASSMKFLCLKASPRQAAISGAGVAFPASPAELARNPLASLSAEKAEIGLNQIIFSDDVDAHFTSLYYALPYKQFAFSAGLEFLGYGDLEGRDEDGFLTGEYSSSAYALQLGVGFSPNMFRWAVSARFASQTIDDATAFGFLADAGAMVNLNKYFSFGASLTNVGYVTSYESEHEVPPTALQSGITALIPKLYIFNVALHADLYRRADSDMHFLTGLELAYHDILVLRMGYALRPDTEDGLSGGLGIHFGKIEVEYAYAANPSLGGNHHLRLGLKF